jgi:prepilin-type N-terminal cleavage/methylation domain-containing protein
MQSNLGSARRGFTLVELLVVIVIIGILAGLITVAASSALIKGKNTKIKTEMSQIDTALRAYQQKYGSYPPDSWDFSDPASKARFLTHVQRAFPRVAIDTATGLPFAPVLSPTADPAEALVFWLRGFNPDPTNPLYEEDFTDLNGNKKWDTGEAFVDKNGNSKYDGRTDTPIYTFDVSRLGTGTNGLATYLPPGAKVPYAYFNIVSLLSQAAPATGAPYFDPDLSATPQQFSPDPEFYKPMAVPYFSVPPASPPSPFGTPVSEEGFQIVSAGLDDDYGLVAVEKVGAIWKPKWSVKAAYKVFPAGTFYSPADNDNITNFNERTTLDDARP